MSTTTAIRFRPKGPSLRNGTPSFWQIWLREVAGCPPELAAELWQCFARCWPVTSLSIGYQMSRMRDVESLEAVAQLVDQMSTVLSPTLLLQLTLKVSPEGRLRKRSILGMEERLLAHVITSPDGTPTWQQY